MKRRQIRKVNIGIENYDALENEGGRARANKNFFALAKIQSLVSL